MPRKTNGNGNSVSVELTEVQTVSNKTGLPMRASVRFNYAGSEPMPALANQYVPMHVIQALGGIPENGIRVTIEAL